MHNLFECVSASSILPANFLESREGEFSHKPEQVPKFRCLPNGDFTELKVKNSWGTKTISVKPFFAVVYCRVIISKVDELLPVSFGEIRTNTSFNIDRFLGEAER